MYLPMKTVKESKGTHARRPGIWLGVIERTEDAIIVTPNGVVKCRTLSRVAEGDQWNRELILSVRGHAVGTNSGQTRDAHTSGC